jgi:MerR-like DNA binding protein
MTRTTPRSRWARPRNYWKYSRRSCAASTPPESSPIALQRRHRRYSRRQLAIAARMRELFDEGMTLDAAARIVGLQDELDTARGRIDELEAQHGVLRGPDTPASTTSTQNRGVAPPVV